MSEFNHSAGKGRLFKNDRRESDKHPEFKGGCCAICPKCKAASQYDVSLWQNAATGDHKACLSLQIKEKWVRPEGEAQQPSQAPQETLLGSPAPVAVQPAPTASPDPTTQQEAGRLELVDGLMYRQQPDGSWALAGPHQSQ